MSKNTLYLMMGTAMFFDLMQVLVSMVPFVGLALSPMIGFFAFLTFWFWLKSKGVDLLHIKRAKHLAGVIIIEFFPFINMLPTWTALVWKSYIDQKRNKKV